MRGAVGAGHMNPPARLALNRQLRGSAACSASTNQHPCVPHLC